MCFTRVDYDLTHKSHITLKRLAFDKHSTLFSGRTKDKEKKFFNIDYLCQSFKTFSSSLMLPENKLDGLSQTRLFSLV